MQDIEDEKEYYEMLYSEHDMANEHMNSQKPAQDVYKTGPINILSWMRQGLNVLSLPNKLQVVYDFWGRECHIP